MRDFARGAKDVPAREREAWQASRAFLSSLALAEDPHTGKKLEAGPHLPLSDDEQKLQEALRYLVRHPKARPEGQRILNRCRPLYPDREAVATLSLQLGKDVEGEVFIINPDGSLNDKDKGNPRLYKLVIRLITPWWGQIWLQLSMENENLKAKLWAEDDF